MVKNDLTIFRLDRVRNVMAALIVGGGRYLIVVLIDVIFWSEPESLRLVQSDNGVPEFLIFIMGMAAKHLWDSSQKD